MRTDKLKITQPVFFGTRGSQVRILSPRPFKTPLNTDKNSSEDAVNTAAHSSLQSLQNIPVSPDCLWEICGPLGRAPVLVDFSDSKVVESDRWRIRDGYVVNGKGIRLHRLLMGAKPGQTVDHINGDPLDNRRSNLRICSQRQNLFNRRKFSGERTSQYKGVWFANAQSASPKPWRAHMRINGKCTYLGSFATEIEAARAYDAAAIEYQGEFARLNLAREHGGAA